MDLTFHLTPVPLFPVVPKVGEGVAECVAVTESVATIVNRRTLRPIVPELSDPIPDEIMLLVGTFELLAVFMEYPTERRNKRV
jgi:hypothetical protein